MGTSLPQCEAQFFCIQVMEDLHFDRWKGPLTKEQIFHAMKCFQIQRKNLGVFNM